MYVLHSLCVRTHEYIAVVLKGSEPEWANLKNQGLNPLDMKT